MIMVKKESIIMHNNQNDNTLPPWKYNPEEFYEWSGEVYDNERFMNMYDTAPKNTIILVNNMCFMEIVENNYENFLKINVDIIKHVNNGVYNTNEKILKDTINKYLSHHKNTRFRHYEVYDVEKREQNIISIILQFEITRENIKNLTWGTYMDDIEYLGMEFIYISNPTLQNNITGIQNDTLLNTLGSELVRNQDIIINQLPVLKIHIDEDMMKIQQSQKHHISQEKIDKLYDTVREQSDHIMNDIEKYISDESYRDGMLYTLEELQTDTCTNNLYHTLTLYIPMRKLRIISWEEAIYPFQKFHNEVISPYV